MNSRFKKTVAIFLFAIALTSGVLAPNSAFAYVETQAVSDSSDGFGFFALLAEFFEELFGEATDVITVPGGNK